MNNGGFVDDLNVFWGRVDGQSETFGCVSVLEVAEHPFVCHLVY